jgi:hypothetical protein
MVNPNKQRQKQRITRYERKKAANPLFSELGIAK